MNQAITTGTTPGLTIRECAAALGVPEARLRFWIREGAPVLHRGRRGAGKASLLDVDQVRAWQAARNAPAAPDHRAIVERSEQAVATALHSLWRGEAGPDKVSRAGRCVQQFLETSHNLRDPLGLADITNEELPLEIEQMILIATFR